MSAAGYDHFLRPKRDRYTLGDRPDCDVELTPALHEFRKVEMRVLCPGQYRKHNKSCTVRNCTKSKIDARGAACIR